MVIAIIAAAGLSWLAFFWQFGKIKTTSDMIQEQQLSSQVDQERRQKILELGKELVDIENNTNEMKNMLVDKNNAVPFLEALENISSSTGNSIVISVVDLSKAVAQNTKKPVASEDDSDADSNSKTSPAKKATAKSAKPDYSNQLGFSLSINGTFPSLINFLNKIENIPYFIQVYDFKIAPISKNQSAKTENSDSSQDDQNKLENSLNTMITIGVYSNGTK